MQSSITHPLSLMQAYRVFIDDPLHKQLGKDSDEHFDKYLSDALFVYPSDMPPLSEGQVHDLVAFWVRVHAAKEKRYGCKRVCTLMVKDVIRQLTALHRLLDCLPIVEGLWTTDYWTGFVNRCAEMYGATMEHSSGE